MKSQINRTDRFKLNSSEVAVKVIDGEAVAIDVVTGKYHGMSGTACNVLNMLSLGHSIGDVGDILDQRYPESRNRIRTDLDKFAGQLLEQRILLFGEGTGAATAEIPAFDGTSYASPELETYDDMAELLALDPPMPTVLDTPWGATG